VRVRMEVRKIEPAKSKALLAVENLVIVSLFAAMGIVIKQFLRPVMSAIFGPLNVAGLTGAVMSGFYMMWLVLAAGYVRKFGAATLCAFLQSFIILFMPVANHGIFSFVTYLLPGVAVDLVMVFNSRMKKDVIIVYYLAGSAAALTGITLTGMFIFLLPAEFIVFLLIVAFVSGGLGGCGAYVLLRKIREVQKSGT